MCGITGVMRLGADIPLRETIVQMTRYLRHRGPDSSGEWVDDDAGIAFGHRRLAILDLSEHGAQPMHSHDGRYVVTYNGEIYNFLDLRSELVAQGITFRSSSDTEVLLECIARWGFVEAMAKFDGMFALGVWDRRERRLWLARDPFGEKPLYYSEQAVGVFAFGSELRAIEAVPSFRDDIDEGALFAFLQMACVPAPRSIFRGVHKLEPGQWLCVMPDGSQKSGFYFRAADEIRDARRAEELSDVEALDALDKALRRSIRNRMLSDVPLGAFLSAGVDSSLVVALMQQEGRSATRTFTVGIAGYEDNEAPLARRTARLLGTEHTELEVSSEDAMRVAMELPTLYDEPFADSSQIPTYLVAKLARTNVTVVLTGDGGDELFGGYARQLTAERNGRILARIPALPRRVAASAASLLASGLTHPLATGRMRDLGRRAVVASALLAARDLEDEYRVLTSAWIRPDLVALNTTASSPSPLPTVSAFRPAQATFIDTVSYLPDDILTKVDRATMAVSLEARVPFLNRELLRIAWRTRHSARWEAGRGKLLLRRLAARYLPDEVASRRKTGFGIPIGRWLRADMRDWAESLLTRGALNQTNVFDASVVQTHWKDHLAGLARETFLWPILVYQSFALSRRAARTSRS